MMRRGGETKTTAAYLRLFLNRSTCKYLKLTDGRDEITVKWWAKLCVACWYSAPHSSFFDASLIAALLPRHLTILRTLIQQLVSQPVSSRLTGLGSVWCDNWPLSGVKKAAYARLLNREVSQIWVKVSGPLTATHPLETRKDTYYVL